MSSITIILPQLAPVQKYVHQEVPAKILPACNNMVEAGKAEEEELLHSITKLLPEGRSPRWGLMPCKTVNNSR